MNMNVEQKNTYVRKELQLPIFICWEHDSISVFELTETVGVGRTSFYHNYESKKDLLVEEEKRLFKESK